MKSKSEILASNPKLISYRVMLHEDKGEKFQIAFDCYAEDDDQATEQALSSYPNGEVTSTTPWTVAHYDACKSNSPKLSTAASIDWALLRKQKFQLVSMADDDDRLMSEIEVLDGVLALLDHIQDDAVAQGRATELEVFGPDWVIYSASESAISDGAGFWSNNSGWTPAIGAERFDDVQKENFGLPIARGNDAKWVLWSEVLMLNIKHLEPLPECLEALAHRHK